MKKIIKNLLVFSFLSCLVLVNFSVANADTSSSPATGVTNYGLGDTKTEIKRINPDAVAYVDPATKIGQIIGYLLSFVGLIFLILVIVGGYKWMVAGGNEEEVNKAKALFTQAVFGLIIISAAYLLVNFVSSLIITQTVAQ